MLGRYRDDLRAWSDPVGRGLFRLRLRPNHLTVMGLAVSLLAAAAFIAGHTQGAGLLLILAGLFDLFDGSLARASGQVTAFGAFLDSVIDRYSDLVVLLGIVVFYARTPHTRGALVAMAGLVGSVMVSYTKARAESIGIECNVGVMERPERMICLIAGALFGLMEPALWALAVLANITALQRILYTRRQLQRARTLEPTILGGLAFACVLTAAAAATASPAPSAVTLPATLAPAVEAYQNGDPAPLARELAAPAVLESTIGDYARLLLADVLARRGDVAAARAAALAVADRYPHSRLVPGALIQAAVLASRAGDEAAAQTALKRLLESYPDAAEGPQALYMLGQVTAARGHPETAALAYRQLMVLAPASAYAEGAADGLAALAATGTPTPPLSIGQRIDRAERLLRGGVPKTAGDEAERIVSEARDPSIALRALEVVAEAAQRLGRWEAAARAKELAVTRAAAPQKPRLQLEQGRLLLRAGQRQKALPIFTAVAASGSEAEASEALYQHARTLDDLERNRDAAAVYRTLATRYPKREVAGAAMWRLGWLAYLRGDVKGAAQQWARLMDSPGGRVYRTAAIYWRARATEQLTGAASARRLYAQAVAEAPRGYYGMLAADRLRREAGGDPPAGDANALPAERAKGGTSLVLPADPTAALAEDPAFLRVELLRRIGLVEYAWQELEDVVHRATGDTVRLYSFSSAYVRDDRFHMALRIFRRHFSGLAAADDPGLPRAFWEMLYPLGWGEDIGEAARRAGLDPFLVAAVVREESSFYPRALSRAGARGLMQLMPATARPMAEVRGLPFNAGDLLDDPGANLEMGAAFLAGLLKDFGDVRLALAAYNAGPGRLRQWWKARRTSDLEAFVEQIPYDETRQYVKRVMLSWREYTRIYGGS